MLLSSPSEALQILACYDMFRCEAEAHSCEDYVVSCAMGICCLLVYRADAQGVGLFCPSTYFACNWVTNYEKSCYATVLDRGPGIQLSLM
jgi:hypothetical protein